MEVVFVDSLPKGFKKNTNQIVGIYGDISDLSKAHFDINGISYDDKWTVKRLLNGWKIFKSKNIDKYLELFELDKSILTTKIRDLSKTKLNFVLFIYLLLNNKKIIIFDYFDVDLAHKDKRIFSKVLRLLKKDGFSLLVVSNDLVYLSTIVENLYVFNNGDIEFNGTIDEFLKINHKNDAAVLEFIDKCNNKGAHLHKTLDSRELLKDIYRRLS